MSEECTTPDLAERVRVIFQAADRGDFGNGVVLAENHHRGRFRGSGMVIDRRAAFVYEFVNGLILRVTEHDECDEARAGAERLAQERG